MVDDVVEEDSPKFELNDENLDMGPAVNSSLEDGVVYEETTISQLEDNNIVLNEENSQESSSTKKKSQRVVNFLLMY